MNVAQIVAACRDAGVILEAVPDGRLRFQPTPPDELLTALREAKAEVLAHLRGDGGMRAFLDSVPPCDAPEAPDTAADLLASPQLPLEGDWEMPPPAAMQQAVFIAGVNYLNEMDRQTALGVRANTPGLLPIEEEALRQGYTRDANGWHYPDFWQRTFPAPLATNVAFDQHATDATPLRVATDSAGH